MSSHALFALLVAWTASAATPSAAPERLILMFEPSTPPAQRLALAASQGRFVRELAMIHAVVVEVDPARRALSPLVPGRAGVIAIETAWSGNWLHGAQSLAGESSRAGLETVRATAAATRRRIAARAAGKRPPKPGKDAPEGVRRVRAVQAWAVTRGAGVKVGVIDTGVDARHRDLAPNVKGGWNIIKNSPDFHDDHGHGTHVSGTIAAIADGRGVAGAAPEAELYGIKVINKGGWGTTDDVIAGMQWALDHGMQVVNMSIGGEEPSKAMDAAVKALRAGGVLVVASAGNNGRSVNYPAACPGALAIAAVDGGNRLTSWSSRGKEVAFVAPGVEVESTFPGGGTQRFSGTSMSSPHVAGVAALFLAAHPGARADEAEAGLRRTAYRLPTIPHFWQGSGLPDAERAVR